MKKILFLILTLFITAVQVNAQKTIAVQSNGTATFHTDWASAWAATQAGDTIYLPGGTFNIGNFTIDKQVAIIGVGHDPTQTHDSLFSHLNGNLYLAEGTDNTLLHGFAFNYLYFYPYNTSQNVPLENITISRCKINMVTIGYASPSPVQHITFTENVLNEIWGYQAQNVQFYKNIIDGRVRQFNGTTIFSNNIFTYGQYSNYVWHLPIITVSNCLFQNNIFKVTNTPLSGDCTNNLMQNNILQANYNPNPQTEENTWTGNFINQPFAEVFVGYTSGSFSPLFDYHLLPTSVGVNAGVDGHDIGIYGTAVPYKEGAVPFNPRVVFEEVSNQTDEEGNISIQVEVESQPR